MDNSINETQRPTKEQLIASIDWGKEFEDLSDDQKCTFISLHGIGMLPRKGGVYPELMERILSLYDADRNIVEDRGVENLYLYIPETRK